MKKVALVFVVAVLVPSLVLAWLALRSQRDLQFLFERQQSLLYQRVQLCISAGFIQPTNPSRLRLTSPDPDFCSRE
jgi:hypothetical protein